MNELLTLARCARRFGVTAAWLRSEAEAGRVPCLKAGSRYLFNPAAVQESLSDLAAKSRLQGVGV